MQRLRGMSLLGFTFGSFPRARHTRLDHAVGVYHLAGLTLKRIAESGAYLEDRDVRAALAAALLLDAGRYPLRRFRRRDQGARRAHPQGVKQALDRTHRSGEGLEGRVGPRAPQRLQTGLARGYTAAQPDAYGTPAKGHPVRLVGRGCPRPPDTRRQGSQGPTALSR